MVVDTSALVAMARGEAGFERLRAVFDIENAFIPSPAVVEFHRVMAGRDNRPSPDALIVIDSLLASGSEIVAFDRQSAEAAVAANQRFGTGNGDGGKLNLLDLIVYGVARVIDLPILCTGNDFASTDALIHPASRVG